MQDIGAGPVFICCRSAFLCGFMQVHSLHLNHTKPSRTAKGVRRVSRLSFHMIKTPRTCHLAWPNGDCA